MAAADGPELIYAALGGAVSAAPAAAAGPCPRAERGQDEVPEIPDGAADGHRRHPLQPRQPPAAQEEAVVRARRARRARGRGRGGRAVRPPAAGPDGRAEPGGAAAISDPLGPSAAASRAHAGVFRRDPWRCPATRRAARHPEGGAGTRRLTGTGAPVSRPGLSFQSPPGQFWLGIPSQASLRAQDDLLALRFLLFLKTHLRWVQSEGRAAPTVRGPSCEVLMALSGTAFYLHAFQFL